MASNRKGVSFRTRPAASARPQRSPSSEKPGGEPVGATMGASNRMSQPLGAMIKAKPSAMAAWGMASSGARDRRSQENERVPWSVAASPTASANERNVASNPLTKVAVSAAGSSGAASSMRQGSREKPRPPSSGR